MAWLTAGLAALFGVTLSVSAVMVAAAQGRPDVVPTPWWASSAALAVGVALVAPLARLVGVPSVACAAAVVGVGVVAAAVERARARARARARRPAADAAADAAEDVVEDVVADLPAATAA